jgi:hypothetical protein
MFTANKSTSSSSFFLCSSSSLSLFKFFFFLVWKLVAEIFSFGLYASSLFKLMYSYIFWQERLESGVESVGDEDVARALLAACKGATEPVLNTYDQLLSNGAILPSPKFRLRLLRSVLVVLREWAMSVFAQRIGTSATGASLILGGTFSLEQTAVINQGVRDKITSAANR